MTIVWIRYTEQVCLQILVYLIHDNMFSLDFDRVHKLLSDQTELLYVAHCKPFINSQANGMLSIICYHDINDIQ